MYHENDEQLELELNTQPTESSWSKQFV